MPVTAGIGLRDRHFRHIDEQRPAIGWLEVHSENFFGDDPRRHGLLARLHADYPMSLHGVGLSLGSTEMLDPRHLAELRRLVERYQPWVVSEHCCWGAAGGLHSNNLLPLPRTRDALDVLCAHVGQTQDALGRTIALENVSTYLEFEHAEFTEPEFLNELARRSGCHLLLDINNLYINSVNHGFDPLDYLAGIRADVIVEYHLAGYENRGHTLIDTHGAPVSEPVWALYAETLQRIGLRPTLIEWDTDVPELSVLLAEMKRAEQTIKALS
ncbi:MAG: DUF692 domain-containing protein [Nevskiaceae bacterium]|nr:MAG: DUF692 domain-containing protein [Nevskiaceae bacterium]